MYRISASPLVATLALVLVMFGCVACNSNWLGVHHLAIEQGNLYTQKDVARLKVGMSREQVRYIIGTPMLQDPFNQSRWDYYYSAHDNKKRPIKQYHLRLQFQDNQLTDIQQSGAVPQKIKAKDKGQKPNQLKN